MPTIDAQYFDILYRWRWSANVDLPRLILGKLRRNYVVLIALWYGSKKPPTKPYLEWAMEELSRLQEHGFSVGGVTYFVKVVIVTTDTVARPILRCTSQFNGEFGCDIFLHPGLFYKHLKIKN